jgi:RNA polymerase sigma-70 factor (ECF subfamily)
MAANNNAKAAPSESDFHQAIARRGDHWYAACLRITKNPELAGDAVQDALLNAWRKRGQFEGGAKLETWIHRIAVNSALTLLRSRHPESWAEPDLETADDDPDPETTHQIRELDEDLQRAMQSLSDTERVCFVLKHLEQWRLKEIARELETTTGTVKQAVFRAVQKLRVSMGGLRSAS